MPAASTTPESTASESTAPASATPSRPTAPEPPICPRCAAETIEKIFDSPVPGVWEVLQCRHCLYMWRTSEPPRRTRRDAYPEPFRMTAEDIETATEMPAVPPLRTRRDEAP